MDFVHHQLSNGRSYGDCADTVRSSGHVGLTEEPVRLRMAAMAGAPMKHRNDIDGLQATAVTSVLCYHGNFAWLSPHAAEDFSDSSWTSI